MRTEAQTAGVAVFAIDVRNDPRRGLVAHAQAHERSPALRAALGRYAFAVEITEG